MIKKLLFILGATVLVGLFVATSADAVNVINDACQQGANGRQLCQAKDENIEKSGFASDLTNTLLYILGAIAVIAIIIGAIRYTTANGDASQIKSAKDTVMYAVIGLIVAILAWGIVNFVVGRF